LWLTDTIKLGFMYSEGRPATLPLAGMIQTLNTVSKPCSRDIASLPLGTMITTPALNIDTVAEAVIESIARTGLKGILDPNDIQKLLASPPMGDFTQTNAQV
jgi:hypothetical protein